MKRDIQRIMLATAVPLFLIFILFLLKIVEVGMDWDFSHMGIYPLEKRGITGILTHPPDSGFTVTDSRGLAPHFPCRLKRRRLRNMKNRIQCITVRRRCKSLCGHETGQKNLLPAVNGRRFFTCRKPHVGGWSPGGGYSRKPRRKNRNER